MKKILLLFIICVFALFLISFAFQNTQKSSGSATVQQSTNSNTLAGELETPQNSDDGILDPPKVRKKVAATKAAVITPPPAIPQPSEEPQDSHKDSVAEETIVPAPQADTTGEPWQESTTVPSQEPTKTEMPTETETTKEQPAP